jgi:FAD/FMN-containing dehydrogenase
LWHIRESITLAQAEEGLNIKHDISLPVSAIPAFVASTDTLLTREIEGVRIVNFGHLGDGNLHYNVQSPKGSDNKLFLQTQEDRVNTLVYEAVTALGGSISAEHGVGSLKVDSLPHYKDPVALALMRQVKQALDPQGLLNPGRVVR